VTPDEAFCRDIPESKQEDVMLMIAEAASGWGEHDCITILDRDRIDAINVRANGILDFEGREFCFIVRDGNWDGTVLEAWEETGVQEFEYHKPTQYALQPKRHLISDAIAAGKGPFLLWKWETMLNNKKELAEIPGKYAYDRHFQPGGFVERHWKDAAAKHHFEIVTQEDADETKKRLAEATEVMEATW
jgi:hypothetical protein